MSDKSHFQRDDAPARVRKYLEKWDPNSPQNIAKRKKARRERFRKWVANNWIALASLAVAFISLIVSLLK